VEKGREKKKNVPGKLKKAYGTKDRECVRGAKGSRRKPKQSLSRVSEGGGIAKSSEAPRRGGGVLGRIQSKKTSKKGKKDKGHSVWSCTRVPNKGMGGKKAGWFEGKEVKGRGSKVLQGERGFTEGKTYRERSFEKDLEMGKKNFSPWEKKVQERSIEKYPTK